MAFGPIFRVSITNKGSLFTSVLVSNSIQSEAHAKRQDNLNIGSVIEIELINARYKWV